MNSYLLVAAVIVGLFWLVWEYISHRRLRAACSARLRQAVARLTH